jgi:glutamate mutase epsilon subunit
MNPKHINRKNKHMTTIEQLIETINALESIAEGALELVDEYSGGDSETATALREWLDGVMKDHHAND